MPKKARSAAATTRVRRKAVLAYVSKLFRESAAAMERAAGTQARFAVLAERLAGQAPELRSLDRKADVRLLQAIADGADAVAAVLLRYQNEDRPLSRDAAGRLADGLDRLSDAFKAGAGSLRLLPAKAKSKKSKVNSRIRGIHEEAVDLALDYHVKALAIREAAGIEQPEARWYFHTPELDECADGKNGCACGGSHVILPGPLSFPPLPANIKVPGGAGVKADLPTLIRGLGTTSRLTSTHLRGLAALFALALISASTFCVNSCDPVGVVRVSQFFVYCRPVQGKFYPMIGFVWTICCACPCYYVFTEQKRDDIYCYGQITVLDPQSSQSEANREGIRLGKEMANNYNNALSSGTNYSQPNGITPAFEPPTCPCRFV